MIIRLRGQQIIIDLPKPESEPWVDLITQRVEMDDEYTVQNIVDRYGRIYKQLSTVATESVTITDPVYGEITISAAGVAAGITALAVNWIMEDYGGSLDDNGYVIIEE